MHLRENPYLCVAFTPFSPLPLSQGAEGHAKARFKGLCESVIPTVAQATGFSHTLESNFSMTLTFLLDPVDNLSVPCQVAEEELRSNYFRALYVDTLPSSGKYHAGGRAYKATTRTHFLLSFSGLASLAIKEKTTTTETFSFIQ